MWWTEPDGGALKSDRAATLLGPCFSGALYYHFAVTR